LAQGRVFPRAFGQLLQLIRGDEEAVREKMLGRGGDLRDREGTNKLIYGFWGSGMGE
jgi:hypothetical protein